MQTFKAESMPLFFQFFYMDTAEWSNAAVGVYMRLLIFQWNNGDLPGDIKALSKLAGETPTKFSKIFAEISHKFSEKNDGRLVNLKLDEVRTENREFKQLVSDGGKKGAAIRWGKMDRDANSPPNAKYKYKDNNTNTNTSIQQSEIFENGEGLPPAPEKNVDKYAEYRTDADSCYPFLQLWDDYEKKVDIKEAWRAYKKIGETDRIAIKEHIPKYKAAQPVKNFRKNLQGYLNRRMWESEIISYVDPKKVQPAPNPNTSIISGDANEEDLARHYDPNYKK